MRARVAVLLGVLGAVLSLLLAGAGPPTAASASGPAPATAPGPARASPARGMAERLDLPGLENAARVAPGIYRGARPTREGFASLRKLGVRTVVNLRHYHGGTEGTLCGEHGIGYVRIELESSDAPSDEDVRRFLEILTDPARRPVYFHCRWGRDRTGTMCAAYRMAVERWSLEEAVAEMDAFGFRRIWRDLRSFVEGFPAVRDRIWPEGLPGAR